MDDTFEYPDDQYLALAVNALEYYSNKETSSVELKNILKEIIKNLANLFQEWDEVANYKHCIGYLIDALKVYRADFKDKISIMMHGHINCMLGDLHMWRQR